MLLSRRHHVHHLKPLFLYGDSIEQVNNYKYLGVMITSTLKWDEHIDRISLKAKRLLGYLYRVFYRNVEAKYLLQLYISLVRQHLEYASQVWDPYTQRNIDHLENIQKFALAFVLANGPQGMKIFCKHFNFLDYLVDGNSYVWLQYFNSTPIIFISLLVY